MPALIECVLNDLEGFAPDTSRTAEDTTDQLAQFDLDPDAISNVEGSWESVHLADRTKPSIEGNCTVVFDTEGPSVYESDGYIIVRGREDVHHVFFVYEKTV
jgi:hypothetical protein